MMLTRGLVLTTIAAATPLPQTQGNVIGHTTALRSMPTALRLRRPARFRPAGNENSLRSKGLVLRSSRDSAIEHIPAFEDTEKTSGSIVKSTNDPAYWFWRAAILGMTAVWGSNFAVIRMFESEGGGADVPSSVFSTIRFGMAALATLPFLAGGSKFALSTGFQVGLSVAVGYIGQAIGLESTTAEKAAFICALQVVFVILFTSLKEKSINKQGGISALLGLAGVALLELTGETAPSIGDLWCLLMPLCFGLSYVQVGNAANNFKGEKDEVAFSAAQCGGFAMGSLVWLLGEQFREGTLGKLLKASAALDIDAVYRQLGLHDVGPSFWLACAYTGVITTALAIILQTYAFKKVSATDASVIIVSEPLWAALFAAALLGEELGEKDLIGGSLILMACILNSLDKSTFDVLFSRLTPENES
ncbi:hypothetical protein AAMO2058_000013900 [Amorphochlora amoebiformis]